MLIYEERLQAIHLSQNHKMSVKRIAHLLNRTEKVIGQTVQTFES